jgi:hypothetical protein
MLFTTWLGFSIYAAIVGTLGTAHNVGLPGNGCDAGSVPHGIICRDAPAVPPQVAVLTPIVMDGDSTPGRRPDYCLTISRGDRVPQACR